MRVSLPLACYTFRPSYPPYLSILRNQNQDSIIYDLLLGIFHSSFNPAIVLSSLCSETSAQILHNRTNKHGGENFSIRRALLKERGVNRRLRGIVKHSGVGELYGLASETLHWLIH